MRWSRRNPGSGLAARATESVGISTISGFRSDVPRSGVRVVGLSEILQVQADRSIGVGEHQNSTLGQRHRE